MTQASVPPRGRQAKPSVVLLVGNYQPDRCGVAHYCKRLVGALREIGVESLIFTARNPERAEGAHRALPPEAREVVDRWTVGELERVARALAGYDPDIVHVQHAPSSYGHSRAHLLLPYLMRRYGLRQRTILTVHEYGGWELSRDLTAPLRPIMRGLEAIGERIGWIDRELLALLPASDRVVVTNPLHEGLLRRQLGARASRLSLVPIGPNVQPITRDPRVPRRSLRTRLGIPEDAPVLGFFGFMHPVKGIETLLAAFAQLRRERPAARLWLVGGFRSLAMSSHEADQYRHRILGQIGELGLGDSVEVSDYLPDAAVSVRLFATDLVVLPFNHGVTLKSGSLLAALAHGCPVVATSRPDGGADLEDGRQALLVPPKDADALAAACARLLDDPALRRSLAQNGRAFAAGFDWREIALRHLRLYVEAAPDFLERLRGGARTGAAAR